MKITSFCHTLIAGLALSGAIAAQAAEFKVETDSQVDGHFPNAQFANVFGCHGGNVSPHIRWQDAPAGTQSFVVTVYDPDAPTGSGWWHWVLADLPASVHELSLGAGSEPGKLPAGAVQFRNDAGQTSFLGACPPAGQTHRYVITVQALKVAKLDLPPTASAAMVGFMSYANGLGKASTTVLAGR
ncbi:YbhB/YbcL family Raf kinase inhibitor-like protein [Rhodoferax sp.]|uniref:YbhB/YbcL family Raf kinase inhibitor-like protein n=1 Tax=Rhodoferax sp. TaxID=50421 RepID=UPI00284B1225|nr:YbhB/YbcL family Raf kinase inhibitor-like protein [Rhodoferax sp.]MDR3371097.1 YbhB/YbcL family Raf kinase inhibitor-like protein [Rhodoferax sp.]